MTRVERDARRIHLNSITIEPPRKRSRARHDVHQRTGSGRSDAAPTTPTALTLLAAAALLRGGGRGMDAAALSGRLCHNPDYAIRALISTPGTEPVLLAEARRRALRPNRERALAYAFAESGWPQAEPLLLGWLGGADARTAEQIYNVLAACGSQAWLLNRWPPSSQDRGRFHGWDNTGAADAYPRLLASGSPPQATPSRP